MAIKGTVCHIAEAFEGGIVRQISHAAKFLDSFGWKFSAILSPRNEAAENAAKQLENSGALIRRIPMCRSPNPIYDYLAYSKIKSALREMNPTLVHTHCGKAGVLGRRAAKKLAIPAVHTPHVFPFEMACSSPMRWMYRKIEQWAAGWCTRIIALTEIQRERAINQRIASSEKIVVLPNGVEIDYFRPTSDSEREAARSDVQKNSGVNLSGDLGVNSDSPLIAAVGRLAPQKGLDIFFNTAELILKAIPNAQFVVAGEGALLPACEAMIRSLKLTDHVRLLGELPEAELRTLYQSADCFVQTSLWEGLPYSMLEAMACELPVVVTPTAGARAVIEHTKTGWLTEQYNPAEIANAVVKILGNPDMAKRLGAWARQSVIEHFDATKWAAQLATIYNTIIA